MKTLWIAAALAVCAAGCGGSSSPIGSNFTPSQTSETTAPNADPLVVSNPAPNAGTSSDPGTTVTPSPTPIPLNPVAPGDGDDREYFGQ